MAGFTTFTVLVGGAETLDRDALDQLISDHGLVDNVCGGPDDWEYLVVYDVDRDEFDATVGPLLDTVRDAGGYWRVAQREHDDYPAAWWDVHGRHEAIDPFADVIGGGWGEPTVALHLTADEASHLEGAVDYYGSNALAHDEDPDAADELAVNAQVYGKVRRALSRFPQEQTVPAS